MVRIEMPVAVQEAWQSRMLEADFAVSLNTWLASQGARWHIVAGFPTDRNLNNWLGYYHFLEFDDEQRAVEFILKYG